MPRSSAICGITGPSVCCAMTSTPWSISASRLGLLGGVEPAVDIDHLHRDVGVHLARGDGEGVGAHAHFRHRDRAHISELVGLGHHAGHGAEHGAAFVELGVVEREVGGRDVAGGPFELGVGELLGDLVHVVAIAEAGAVDELVALLRQLAEDALGVRPLGDVGHHGGLDLVGADRIDHFLAAAVMAVIPAIVVGRADQHEADLQLFLRECARAEQRQRRRGATDLDHRASVEVRHEYLLSYDVSGCCGSSGPPYAVATKGLPRQAGAEVLPSRRSEISTSTRTVAR
jgi:hypothetical protein